MILCPHQACLCVFVVQVKRSFGLCSLQLTYFDEENEEVRDCFVVSLIWLFWLLLDLSDTTWSEVEHLAMKQLCLNAPLECCE